MNHELKVLPEYFEALLNGSKNFELRKDDRDYQVNDILKLKEFNGTHTTGKVFVSRIKYILRDCEEYGLMKGFVILGI